MNLKALVAGMGLLSIAASCSEDVTEQINTGSEITFTTRMSRANIINSPADLKEFTVFAEAEGYEGLFINGETATKEDDSNIYNLASTYRWPSDAQKIEFWAYAPKEPAAETTININGAHQAQITGFAPAEYKYPSNTNSGASHNDLIVAYSKVPKSDSGASVQLKFKHTLSQIELRAKLGSGNKNAYTVKIKGAWFRNIYGKGDLSFDDSEDNKFKWANDGTKSLYGYSYNNAITLGLNPTDLLSESNGKSGLMVIPQDIAQWNNIEADRENSGNGAYILILCRIEVTHEGDEHNGGDYVGEATNGHIHQMFPTPDDDTSFNENLYGYVCVPLTNPEGGWQAGKKYVYTLEFCGANSGAGLYPPTGEDIIPGVPKRPNDKQPGDPVLDEPIKFSVEIEGWDETWKPGDGSTTTTPGDTPMR